MKAAWSSWSHLIRENSSQHIKAMTKSSGLGKIKYRALMDPGRNVHPAYILLIPKEVSASAKIVTNDTFLGY